MNVQICLRFLSFVLYTRTELLAYVFSKFGFLGFFFSELRTECFFFNYKNQQSFSDAVPFLTLLSVGGLFQHL